MTFCENFMAHFSHETQCLLRTWRETTGLESSVALQMWLIAPIRWSTRFSTPQLMHLRNGCERSGPSLVLSRWQFYRKTLRHKMGKCGQKSIPKIILNMTDYVQWSCLSAKLHINRKTAPIGLPLDLSPWTFISDLTKDIESIQITFIGGHKSGKMTWISDTCVL